MLIDAGISRHECYITNVSLNRPHGNRFREAFYSDASGMKPKMELLDCRARLSMELHEVKPKVTVLLGEEALRALPRRHGITGERGMMIESKQRGFDVRYMPTFHPANILRQYTNRPLVVLDLKKALRQAKNPYWPAIRFQIIPTFDEIMEWLQARHTPVSFDLETLGNPPMTRRLGFAWSANDAISIPLIMGGVSCWSIEQEQIIIQTLNTYLSDPHIKKYIQNCAFDCSVMANEMGIHVDGIEMDTMYAHHLLFPEFPKSLDFITSIRTDFPIYWKSKDHGDEANATYNCYDCCVTWEAAQQIEEELIERDMWDFYNDKLHPTIFALIRMENRGILMNIPARDEVREITEKKLATAQEVLNKAAGRELNANSPSQVKELIYGDWKLPKQKHPTTKKVRTDDDALRSLSRKFPHYAGGLRAILDCRQTRKLISTYIEAVLDNGYVRTSYGFTVTGRLTSSKTIDGLGGNLQNIPRGEFRRLYTADPGKVIIKADLAQAEYMVFCWEAEVWEYIHAYTTDPEFDVHLLHASQIFEMPPEAVTEHIRYDAKQGVYAGNYGIGPLKLSKMHDMEFKQAKTIIDGYKALRPELEMWWRKIEDQLKVSRTLRNVFGRERIFFGRLDNSTFRAAYDWVCQSTVADIINQSLAVLDRLNYLDVLLQIHDELVCQCDDNPTAIKRAVIAIRSAMEITVVYPNVKEPLIIPVEIAVGPNWYDVTDYNEDKLNGQEGNKKKDETDSNPTGLVIRRS